MTNEPKSDIVSVFLQTMELPEKIIDLLVRQNGTITSRDCDEAGVSRTMLGKYAEAGLLERTGRGLYVAPGAIADELFAISRQYGRIVFSHATAAFLHGMSDRTPFVHSATLMSSQTVPVAMRRRCKCFYVKDDFYGIGLVQVKTQFGNEVPCYDMERTVCDVIRCRAKMDDETFLSIVKNYCSRPGRNISKVGEYAQRMGILSKVNAVMELTT